MYSLVHIGKENTGLLKLKRNHLTRKPTRKPLPPPPPPPPPLNLMNGTAQPPFS